MRAILAASLLVVVVLSGCAASKGGEATENLVGQPGEVDATSTTGGIRGVVIDTAIRPIKGAAIEIAGPEKKSATTDVGGAFTIGGLKPGTYLVRASHPHYDTTQQSVEVQAGNKNPDAVKVQLNQVIFTQPYLKSVEFKGFIVCSVGTGLFASEECGEGVGVECIMDPIPCGRVGGQGNNHVQYDFYPDSSTLRSILVEQVWTPNADATGEFYTVLATDWSCTPSCEGNRINRTIGPSPLYQRGEFKDGAGKGIDNVTASTRFSTFTWPNWGGDPDQANVALNQEFQLFVTTSYELPLPPGWSLVKGDKNPFS